MASNRQLPLDLLVVSGLVLLTDILVLLPVLSGSFLRTYLGILMVLLLPGYALTGAIFPAKNDLEGIERAVVSLGLSIAVVPIMGLVLNYTDWGIREIPILTAISVFTLLMCAVAYYRRRLLPETEVFDIQFKAAFSDMTADIKKSGSAIDRFLAIFLILSVIASVVSLAYIIGTPKEGEHFTEFYILGPNRTADNYQTDFIQGEKGTVYVGIINHEYRPVDYTLDVKLGNKSLPISENQRQIKLAHNETWEAPVTFTPSIEGTNMKLEFLLFNETEKTTPYRNVHLWVNVTKET
jgi:uncharacterized membrane protein